MAGSLANNVLVNILHAYLASDSRPVGWPGATHLKGWLFPQRFLQWRGAKLPANSMIVPMKAFI
jgi:hypothetical protein